MDERLKSALDLANLMVTYNNQKELIKQEYKEDCLFHKDGHRFTIDKELINFLVSLKKLGYIADVVILDDFDNPYMISDVNEFLDSVFSRYFEMTNRYYHRSVTLKNSRSVSKMVDLDV
jgi:hypothetical protein